MERHKLLSSLPNMWTKEFMLRIKNSFKCILMKLHARCKVQNANVQNLNGSQSMVTSSLAQICAGVSSHLSHICLSHLSHIYLSLHSQNISSQNNPLKNKPGHIAPVLTDSSTSTQTGSTVLVMGYEFPQNLVLTPVFSTFISSYSLLACYIHSHWSVLSEGLCSTRSFCKKVYLLSCLFLQIFSPSPLSHDIYTENPISYGKLPLFYIYSLFPLHCYFFPYFSMIIFTI